MATNEEMDSVIALHLNRMETKVLPKDKQDSVNHEQVNNVDAKDEHDAKDEDNAKDEQTEGPLSEPKENNENRKEQIDPESKEDNNQMKEIEEHKNDIKDNITEDIKEAEDTLREVEDKVEGTEAHEIEAKVESEVQKEEVHNKEDGGQKEEIHNEEDYVRKEEIPNKRDDSQKEEIQEDEEKVDPIAEVKETVEDLNDNKELTTEQKKEDSKEIEEKVELNGENKGEIVMSTEKDTSTLDPIEDIKLTQEQNDFSMNISKDISVIENKEETLTPKASQIVPELYDSPAKQTDLDNLASKKKCESTLKKKVKEKAPTYDITPAFPLGKRFKKFTRANLKKTSTEVTQSSKKDKLKTLFMKYAEISSDNGMGYLKSRHYINLLKKSKIIDDKKLTKSKAEIIFMSNAGRKEMNFESFFKSLITLAETKYPTMDNERAIKELSEKYLFPLCKDFISTDFRQLVYEGGIKNILNSVYYTLERLYTFYFADHFKEAQSMEQVDQITSKQVLAFIKDFDIIKNYTLSKQLIINMLDILLSVPEVELTNNSKDHDVLYSEASGPEVTNYLTLGRFFILLFWIAVVGTKEHDNKVKLIYLLRKMQISKGFAEFSKKSCKTHSMPLTLIPIDEIINPPDKKLLELALSKDLEESKEGHLECMRALQKLFISYSSIVSSNINKITWFKFTNLLKDCGVIKGIHSQVPIVEIELLFKKALNTADEVKLDSLDFKAFSSVIEQLAIQLYPDTPQAFAIFCEKVILTLSNLESKTKCKQNINTTRSLLNQTRKRHSEGYAKIL